ncbi:APC family permease [Lentzea sp. HUAS12]|uniref:APC family permease n=1 Tax=Lentzea sp. HUAS12 TaxID=2951806 RepID=UPI0020A0548D|nr:amino acid permease [Lentzea sp. HUAS12]USX56275.1 amino acid permease [Lentzea sp. HUAS12]
MSARPRIGFAEGTALYVGAVLGPGALVLPAMAVREAGPAAVAVWTALIVVSVPVALSFAMLGRAFPDSGGVASYVRRAFGDVAATATGWCFCLALPIGVFGGAVIGGRYAAEVLGGGAAAGVVVAVGLLAAAFIANWSGLRVTTGAQLVLVGLTATLLVTIAVVNVPSVEPERFTPFLPHGWSGLASASALLCFAFTGWEAVSHLSEDFRSPRTRLVPVTVLALAIVAVLYLGLAVTTTGVLGDSAATSPVPVMALLEHAIGSVARPVTAVAAVVLSLGAVNTYIAGGARLIGSLARAGALPGWAGVAAPHGTPRRGLLILAVATALAGVVSVLVQADLDGLLLLTSVCLVAVTGAGTAAAAVLLSGTGRAAAGFATVCLAVVTATGGVLVLLPVATLVVAVLLHRWRGVVTLARGPGPRSAVTVGTLSEECAP